MDPSAIMGTTSAILSFIEAGTKFVSLSRELYHSTSGMSRQTEELKSIDVQIGSIASSLRKSAARKDSVTGAQKSLTDASEHCLKACCDIQRLLDTLVSKPGSRLKSLAVAAMALWKSSEIEDLQDKVKRAQELLSLATLALIREETQRSLQLLQAAGFERLKELQAVKKCASHFETESSELHGSQATLKLSLKQALDICAEANNAVRLFRSYLESLDFPLHKERFSNVLDAHESTFEYMFNDDAKLMKNHPELQISFTGWLQHGQGIFHVVGKPGSGKSTLMKYLVQDSRTSSLLWKWSGEGNSFVLAPFFFWKPGSPLQRNINGLVRSILHTTLSACPDLVAPVFQNDEESERREASWKHTRTLALTDRDIRQAFRRLVTAELYKEQNGPRTCICFFIDGLDEFEDAQEDYSGLANNLREWVRVSSGTVKMCVSGRDLPVFRDLAPRQRIYLHLLTASDIKTVVDERLVNTAQFRAMRKASDQAAQQCDALAEQILTRAEGVFLWVHLVIRMLRKGLLENGDSIATMQKRLDDIPSELRDLFRHMLDSIEPCYKREMYATLTMAMHQVALASTGTDNPLGDGRTLFRYALLFDFLADPKFAISLRQQKLKEREIRKKLDTARCRLSAFCNCLVEIRPASDKNPHNWMLVYRETVNFIHRSVPEWLEEHLVGRIEDFDADAATLATFIAEVKSVPMSDRAPEARARLCEIRTALQRTYKRYIKQGRDERVMCELLTLDDALTFEDRHPATNGRRTLSRIIYPNARRGPGDASLLHFAALIGEYNYVSFRLRERPNTISPESGTLMLRRVVEMALFNNGGDGGIDKNVRELILPSRDLLSTLAALLESGEVSVDARVPDSDRYGPRWFSGVSVWFGLLDFAFSPSSITCREREIITDNMFWAFVALFLRAGASSGYSLMIDFSGTHDAHGFPMSVVTNSMVGNRALGNFESCKLTDALCENNGTLRLQDLAKLFAGPDWAGADTPLPQIQRYLAPLAAQEQKDNDGSEGGEMGKNRANERMAIDGGMGTVSPEGTLQSAAKDAREQPSRKEQQGEDHSGHPGSGWPPWLWTTTFVSGMRRFFSK